MPMKFLYLKVELAARAKKIEFDNIEMSDSSYEGTRDIRKWMEEAPIHGDADKPNSDGREEGEEKNRERRIAPT